MSRFGLVAAVAMLFALVVTGCDNQNDTKVPVTNVPSGDIDDVDAF
jgi:uncharacterized lipoprotein YehR (DUF1307 family)